jgi:type I restriction enzyme, S subunit
VNKWEKVKLGTIGDFKSGGTPTRSKPEYFKGNIPWITTTSLGKTFINDNDAVEHISAEAVANSATKIILENSIMIGTRVGVGKVSINSVPMCASQDIISIENIDEQQIYKQYIVHCIRSFWRYFDTQKRGATIQGINSGVLKTLNIPLPPLEIQMQIAKTLDAATELLNMYKQQLVELDNLIKSTFFDMFGDPVTNEKGWETGTIRDIVVEVKYGTSRPATENGQYIYLRMNNITYDGQMNYSSIKYIDLPDDEVEKYVVRKGDVLFNRTNSKELVGKTAVFKKDVPMIIAGYIIRLRVNKKADPEFLSAILNSSYGKATLLGMCKAIVGQANINAQELQNIKIFIPPVKLQTRFASVITKIDEQKELAQRSINESQTLFDSLMSEYFE